MHICNRILRRRRAVTLDLLPIKVGMHVTIIAKLSLHMELTTNVFACLTTTLVTTTVMIEPSVPSCSQVVSTIGLINVHLHAVGACWTASIWALTIAIVVVRLVLMIWADGIEIVIDARLGATVVHIKLHIPSQEVE